MLLFFLKKFCFLKKKIEFYRILDSIRKVLEEGKGDIVGFFVFL